MDISQTKATVIHMDKMHEEEAMLWLYGSVSMDSIDRTSATFCCAQEIITELDYMTLAINLARAYLNETLTSFEKYLRMLKDKKEQMKLLKFSNIEDADRSKYTIIATVWQLSFERIQALNPTAAQLLEAITFFHPENIPTRFFLQQFSVLNLTASENSGPSEAIRKAIVLLEKFLFEKLTTKNGSPMDFLTIHHLLQKVIYDAMNDEQKLSWTHKVASAFFREISLLLLKYNVPHKEVSKRYLSHMIHYVTLLPDLGQQPLMSDYLIHMLNRIVEYCYKYGSDKTFTQQSIRIAEAVYGPEHIQTTRLLYNLSRFYMIKSEYSIAEPLYQRVWTACKKLSETENPDTLSKLAGLYSCMDRYDEAEPLYQRVLAIKEEVLGPEHLDTAATLKALAETYQDKYDEAEPLFKRALEILEKVLGREHPEVASSLTTLALFYERQRKYDEAESLFKQAIAIREKVLGEHLDTASSLHYLARLYENQAEHDEAKYYEAESLFKQILQIHENVLGLNDRETKMALFDLGFLYTRHNKYDETVQLYKRAIETRKIVLGPEQAETANLLYSLGRAYENQGKQDEAEELFKRARTVQATLKSKSIWKFEIVEKRISI